MFYYFFLLFFAILSSEKYMLSITGGVCFMRLLIAEDEKSLSRALAAILTRNNYSVDTVYDGEAALEYLEATNYDGLILDVMMPGMDGFEVCRKVREKSQVPIIMLTAREDEVDKVLGLELGADDYITKPYSMRELTARVKANLRRSTAQPVVEEEPENQNTINSGELSINVERYEVAKNGEIIDITLREFELLKFLAMQPDKIFSREKLLENVWGYEYYGDVRTVDVTVRRLREKIEDDPSMPKYIITKRGVGYYFNK